MLFVELRFVAFFAVVFSAYWALPTNTARKRLLLLASYAFYAAWDWRFLSLIAASTLFDWVAARGMRATESTHVRRAWLIGSSVANLTLLGFFKYWNFFIESGAAFLGWLGLGASPYTLSIVLPVGISFYTFQSLSYSIDVYRRRIDAAPSLADFALFVGFFPQLVAGPIVRARTFLPQLEGARRFGDVQVRACMLLFLSGFVKKACVADRLAAAVDPVFLAPEQYGAASKWLAMGLYHAQIYCDFSGYTDMAIACAGLLGYRLTANFDFPYLAHSVRDFWRRWHISLSTWFRDYAYIPLGGNRAGPARTARNLLLVFFLCGLWHGAAWTFVAWGLLHGALLVVERGRFGPWLQRRGAVAQLFYTQLVVVVAWVFFRSPDVEFALAFLASMLGVATAASGALDGGWALFLAGLAALHITVFRLREHVDVNAGPDWLFAAAYGAAVALVLPWVATGHAPFIYFQF